MLDEIGEHFIEHAVELVKSGLKFVYVLDNIDWEEKAHDVRTDNQNKSVHAVASSIVFARIPSGDLPDAGPQGDLKTTNVAEVVKLTESEMNLIRCRYRILLAKILFEHFPELRIFQSFIPDKTDCPFIEQTSIRSEVITMPILMKDEKKYADCVDVLDQLEEWTHQIYSAAGLCKLPSTDKPSPPAIGNRSRPDQPGSHIRPVPSTDDPLSGVKIPCFGDQLTRVRLAGAKDLRAGCHSARERLNHLYPFCIVDWHTKRSFLKVLIVVIISFCLKAVQLIINLCSCAFNNQKLFESFKIILKGIALVLKVLMKHCTLVWHSTHNNACTMHLQYKYFAKHMCDFSLIL